MIKSLAGKFGVIGLLALGAGISVVGCSSNAVDKPAVAEGPTGNVGLSLVPVAGITLNEVSFVVTSPASTTPVATGTLPTPGSANNFSFGIPLPVGTNYTISLNAVSAETGDDITCTGSYGPFNVTPNTSKNFTLSLVCVDNTKGSATGVVTVTTDACPKLIVDYAVAIPSSTTLGSNIAVSSAAHDLDARPVTLSWAATPIGTFAAPGSASTTLACVSPGDNVAIKVVADNGQCKKSLTTTVSCTSITCGNGALDADETCDKGAAAGTAIGGPFGCPADCKYACGDGVVEAPAEQCEGVATDSCNNCRNRVQLLGDGFITGTEVCDPGGVGGAAPKLPATAPAGSTCKADGTGFNAPPGCNNGNVDPGEVCDVPFTVNDCGADCKAITPAACASCPGNLAGGDCASLANCNLNGNTTATGTGLAPIGTPKKNLCNETLDCIRDTHCAAGLPLDCYCGTVTSADCDAGLGNGACRTQIERGLETKVPGDVQARFGNATLGAGKALARVACEQGPCLAQCFAP